MGVIQRAPTEKHLVIRCNILLAVFRNRHLDQYFWTRSCFVFFLCGSILIFSTEKYSYFWTRSCFVFFEWHYFDIYYRKLFLQYFWTRSCFVFWAALFWYLLQKNILISGPDHVSCFWVALFWYLLQKIVLISEPDHVLCFFERHFFIFSTENCSYFWTILCFLFFCVTISIFIAEKHSYFWTILCFLFLFKWHYFDMYYSHLFLFRTLKTTGSPQKVVKFYTVKILYNLVCSAALRIGNKLFVFIK